MDWSRFSTPRRVRSPVRGGVTANSTGGRLLRPSPKSNFLTSVFMLLASVMDSALRTNDAGRAATR